MKRLASILLAALIVSACAPTSGVRRDPVRECPDGFYLVCESRTQREPSRGGPDEEIPEYEFCRCVPQGI